MASVTKSRLVGVRLDIETRSGLDLKRVGVYRYAEDPDFAVLLISYAPLRERSDGDRVMGKPRLLDLPPPGFDGDPEGAWHDREAVLRFQKLLRDPRFEKHAFNANFERVALSRWVGMPTGTYLDPENWHCSSVRASVNGVFGSLDEVARAVRSPIKKDATGKRLIRLFCSADKKSGKFHALGLCWCGTDHAEDFTRFGDYCNQDVLTEAGVASLLADIPRDVQRQYEADQRINDRGVRHHGKLSQQAVAQVEIEKDRLMAELQALTGLDNPNSGKQMQGWLNSQGYPMESLNKASREQALADPLIPEEVAEALTLKGLASLSSVAKHKAALNTRCSDGRIRGSLQFYGAHTGREAGRGIQPQNLPRYEAPAADRARLLRGSPGPMPRRSPRELCVPASSRPRDTSSW